jgi:hypothetical protein
MHAISLKLSDPDVKRLIVSIAISANAAYKKASHSSVSWPQRLKLTAFLPNHRRLLDRNDAGTSGRSPVAISASSALSRSAIIFVIT